MKTASLLIALAFVGTVAHAQDSATPAAPAAAPAAAADAKKADAPAKTKKHHGKKHHDKKDEGAAN